MDNDREAAATAEDSERAGCPSHRNSELETLNFEPDIRRTPLPIPWFGLEEMTVQPGTLKDDQSGIVSGNETHGPATVGLGRSPGHEIMGTSNAPGALRRAGRWLLHPFLYT